MNTEKRVEELAREKNISLARLAELSGIGYSTLKNARLRGSQLSVDTIECICKGLGITLGEFFTVNGSGKENDTRKYKLDGQITFSDLFEMDKSFC